jgi:hypothetical protein
MNPHKVFENLINNNDFINLIKNETNINKIIYIIIKHKVSYYNLPHVIRLIFNFSYKKFNIHFDENEINIAIRLAMIELTIRNDLDEAYDDLSLFNFFVKV